MRAGKVVFDGIAADLTQAAARDIYGDDGLKEAFSEAITSTSLGALKPAAIAVRRAEAALAG
jgi:phosphonate transport system ATP-binding protein